MTTANLIVRGIDLHVQRPQRYAAIAVRPEPVHAESGTYVAFARVDRTSNSLRRALRTAREEALFAGPGVVHVVVDTTTGEEVA